MVKSMESFYFSHTILRKGMHFRRIIRGKSKLPTYHTAEKHDFPRDYPWKVKTFREISCGMFQYTAESQIARGKFQYTAQSQIALFKGFSLLQKIILDKESPMGDQYYPRFKRKI
jgi:hypothetical protein